MALDGQSTLIRFYEFEKKKNSSFSGRDLDLLEKINRKSGCEIFKLLRNEVCATQYVGFVRCGRKTIQVIPKIFQDDSETNLHFLLRLLQYTRKLSLKEMPLSNLTKFKDDFFEFLIWLYAKNLQELLRHDLKRSYVNIEDKIQYLRGKILVSRQIREEMKSRTGLYCRFDEFTENTLLNQALKYVSRQLFLASTNIENRKMLQYILYLLAGVDDRTVTLPEVEKISFNRLNMEYKPIVDLCRLFLSGMTVSLQASRLETFAFMFDMNRLFEEFICRFIDKHKRSLSLHSVKGQRRLGTLFGEFNMYYDLLVTDMEGRQYLMDTKYKRLDSERTHHGLSQSDFYQMFAYSQSQLETYENIILLYPKYKMQERDFKHVRGDTKVNLSVRCVDLEQIWDRQNRRLNELRLLEDLSRCFN